MGMFDGLLGFSGSTDKGAGISGATTGIVKDNWDKEHPGMVKVEYSMGENGKNVTGWVPVMSSYSGSDFGYYSLPEIKSEVVIIFSMGDRNCPIVIGTLWSKKNKLPAKTAVEKNTVKRFKTKGGCQVIFTDEDKKEKIEILTPKMMGSTIEDEKETLTISDKGKKNVVEIDSKNGTITLNAKKKMNFQINGKDIISLDGQKVNVTTSNFKVDAKQSVQLKGNSSFKAEGATADIKAKGSAKVTSSGVLTLKGSITKIN